MKPIIFILICIGLFTSCASEKSVIQEEDRLVTLSGLNDMQWTYISLSTGEVVGTSPLNSAEDDAHWRLRTVGIWLFAESIFVRIVVLRGSDREGFSQFLLLMENLPLFLPKSSRWMCTPINRFFI